MPDLIPSDKAAEWGTRPGDRQAKSQPYHRGGACAPGLAGVLAPPPPPTLDFGPWTLDLGDFGLRPRQAGQRCPAAERNDPAAQVDCGAGADRHGQRGQVRAPSSGSEPRPTPNRKSPRTLRPDRIPIYGFHSTGIALLGKAEAAAKTRIKQEDADGAWPNGEWRCARGLSIAQFRPATARPPSPQTQLTSPSTQVSSLWK